MARLEWNPVQIPNLPDRGTTTFGSGGYGSNKVGNIFGAISDALGTYNNYADERNQSALVQEMMGYTDPQALQQAMANKELGKFNFDRATTRDLQALMNQQQNLQSIQSNQLVYDTNKYNFDRTQDVNFTKGALAEQTLAGQSVDTIQRMVANGEIPVEEGRQLLSDISLGYLDQRTIHNLDVTGKQLQHQATRQSIANSARATAQREAIQNAGILWNTLMDKYDGDRVAAGNEYLHTLENSGDADLINLGRQHRHGDITGSGKLLPSKKDQNLFSGVAEWATSRDFNLEALSGIMAQNSPEDQKKVLEAVKYANPTAAKDFIELYATETGFKVDPSFVDPVKYDQYQESRAITNEAIHSLETSNDVMSGDASDAAVATANTYKSKPMGEMNDTLIKNLKWDPKEEKSVKKARQAVNEFKDGFKELYSDKQGLDEGGKPKPEIHMPDHMMYTLLEMAGGNAQEALKIAPQVIKAMQLDADGKYIKSDASSKKQKLLEELRQRKELLDSSESSLELLTDNNKNTFDQIVQSNQNYKDTANSLLTTSGSLSNSKPFLDVFGDEILEKSSGKLMRTATPNIGYSPIQAYDEATKDFRDVSGHVKKWGNTPKTVSKEIEKRSKKVSLGNEDKTIQYAKAYLEGKITIQEMPLEEQQAVMNFLSELFTSN